MARKTTKAKAEAKKPVVPSNVLEYNGIFVKFAVAKFGYKYKLREAQTLIDEFEAAPDEKKADTLLAQMLAELCASSPIRSTIFMEVTAPKSKTEK